MWRPGWIRSVEAAVSDKPGRPTFGHDSLAIQLALVTFICLGLAFAISKGTLVLMPGPLASAHGSIEKCDTCHTKSGSGKMSWTQGLVAGNPHADSRACLTCHKMPDTAFNAHGASDAVLKQSTERLTKTAAATPAPKSARAQSIAFPAHDVAAGGLTCATCHQEHQGVNFKLGKISNEQCRSCHVVKFDRFDSGHPKFENYPFKQRTGIIYDHAGHFGKHYPDLAKKDPTKSIPETCSTCHNSNENKKVMAVAPFDKTCATCHLNQITGKERASGPKGIAFLTLPGLDVESLKKKNAAMGEWPEASEAALSPFMKVMISRDERGRDLLKTVDSLNLQDLSNASDDQIKAVMGLVWEIKGLFHALISGKASDVLADLNLGTGAKLSPGLVADLTASIPLDVLVSAQQQWLPNLAVEMAKRKVPGDQVQAGGTPVATDTKSAESASPATQSATDQRQAVPTVSPQPDGRADQPEGVAANTDVESVKPSDSQDTPSADQSSRDLTDATVDETGLPKVVSEAEARADAQNDQSGSSAGEASGLVKAGPQECMVRVLGQCLMLKGQKSEAEAGQPEGSADPSNAATANPSSGKEKFSAGEFPPAMRAGVTDAGQAAEPDRADGEPATGTAKSESDTEALSNDEHGGATINGRLPLPSGTPREIEARSRDAGKAPQSEGEAGVADTPQSKPDDGEKTPVAKDTPQDKPTEPTATATAKPDGSKETLSATSQPQGKTTDQSDDLLFPTEAELREMKTLIKGASKSAQPDAAAGTPDPAAAVSSVSAAADAAVQPPAGAAPVISIESHVDPESWADYGGWYRQDYAIFYRPIGHKDKFIYSWLFLTGPQAPKSNTGPAAAVFDFLTSKDAQGSCTKCHSVDDIQGKGRVVNFSPASVQSKRGRFTNFIHEPHFGVLEQRTKTKENSGCLACHNFENGQPTEAREKTDRANGEPNGGVSPDVVSKENAAALGGGPADPGAAAATVAADKAVSRYLKSYEQGHPQSFASEFGAVKKELCQTCHNASMARQDCLTCHKYHVNGVVTPVMSTKNQIP
jgi:hypothetical protein